MKIEKLPRSACYVEPNIANKKYLKFKLNSTKRTVCLTNGSRYFLQFPDMEFKIPYYIHKNKATLFFPHYDLKYVYNNKKYVPYLPNTTKVDEEFKQCTNEDLYKNSYSFEKLDDVKNFIIINFFNSQFHTAITFKKPFLNLQFIYTDNYFAEWEKLSKNGLTQELVDFISY